MRRIDRKQFNPSLSRGFTLDMAIKAVSEQDDGSLLIEGYASTYSTDRDKEAVTPQALKTAVDSFMTNPILLLQHDPDQPIGTILEAKVDDVGLWIKAKVTAPVAEWAKEAFAKIRDGVYKAFSIGGIFTRVKDAITAMDLMEVSVVAIPAQPEALFEVVTKAFAAKATWSTAFVNDLPDSAFLYIESGGEKDGDGKTTPRSLRHFPYKDDSGKVDLPHLRNALARIPQSDLPGDVKDRLTTRAQKLLDDNSPKAAKAPGTAHTATRNHFHMHEDGTDHSHAHVHKEGVASHDGAGHTHKAWELAAIAAHQKALPGSPTPAVGMWGDAPEGSYEDLIEDLQRAAAIRYGGMFNPWSGYGPGVSVLATFPSYCVVMVCDADDTDFYEVEYSVGDDGEPVLTGEDREVVLVYVPATAANDPDMGDATLQLSFQPASKSGTAKSGELRLNWKRGGVGNKAGRVLSAANETVLRETIDKLSKVLAQLEKEAEEAKEPAA